MNGEQCPFELGNIDIDLDSGDLNGDGGINVLDIVQLVNIILNP